MTRDEVEEMGDSPDSRTFEHIGGPLHLQIRAIPDNQWRGYHIMFMSSWNDIFPVRYDLRTVHLRDREGHLRIWTGMVCEGYWAD